jgi:hypothetical protein
MPAIFFFIGYGLAPGNCEQFLPDAKKIIAGVGKTGGIEIIKVKHNGLTMHVKIDKSDSDIVSDHKLPQAGNKMTTETNQYEVVLFQSVSHALKAEKILKAKNISYKLIPVPRHISSDCGFCIRFPVCLHQHVADALEGVVEFVAIRPL